MAIDRMNTHNGGFDPAVGEIHSGQIRMAYRLAAQYRGELLYVSRNAIERGWLSWDGNGWTHRDHGAPTRAVLDVLRRALAGGPNDRKLCNDVSLCSSAAGVAGVLDLASALETFAIDADELYTITEKRLAP